MKFKTIMIVLLLLPLCVTRGQSSVSIIHNFPSETTIVRYWQDEKGVIYTHDNDNNNYFLLVDSTVMQVLRIPVPPYVTVSDFRILHDSVFVGGHVMLGTSQRGLLACFAIQDFYNGSGVFSYALAGPTYMPDIYTPVCYNQISDFTRLAVYDDGGHTIIAYIARNNILGETLQRVGIGCAKFEGSSWSSVFIYNKDAKEEYTDIIATQNYVVAVARTNDSARLAMRIFPKNDFITKTQLCFTIPPCYYYQNTNGQGLSDLEVDENVMAAALYRDMFAVAYHYRNSPLEGLALKSFDIAGGTATLLQGMNADVARRPGSVWKMRDVRYSPTLQRLTVLNDFDGGIGSLASIIYQFQPYSMTTGYYYGRYISGHELHSMDPFAVTTDGLVASGFGDGSMTIFWELLYSAVSCGLQDELKFYSTSAALYRTHMETNINEPSLPASQTPFVVDEIERERLCDQY